MAFGFNLGLGLSALRSGTSLSAFAVSGIEPAIVYDAATGTYKKNAANTNFSGLFTAGGASLKTQVNSAGELVWAPHNLLLRSEEFDNASWTKNGSVATASVIANDRAAPNGEITADKLEWTAGGSGSHVFVQSGVTLVVGAEYTLEVWIAPDGCDYGTISISDNGVTDISFVRLDMTGSGSVGTAQNAGSGYIGGGASVSQDNGFFRFSFPVVVGEASSIVRIFTHKHPTADAVTWAPGDGAHLWGAHLYRSDLGGMADNPDQPAGFESYVPTTSAAVYMGRTDHHRWNGSAWVNKGILLESEARTNLVTHSQDFANASWTKTALSIGANTSDTTAPTGDNTASKATISGTDDLTFGSISVTSGATAAFSVYLKRGDFDWIRLRYEEGAGSAGSDQVRAWFNLATGAKGTLSVTDAATAVSHHIEDVGNGWYRCSVVGISDTNTTVRVTLTSADADASVTRAAGFYYLYGAQLEAVTAANPYPSSYIPTAGATVTRAAETLQIDAANMPASTEGYSFFWKGEVSYGDNGQVLGLFAWSNASSTDYVGASIYTNSTRTGKLALESRKTSAAAGETASSDTYFSPGQNIPVSFAGRYAPNIMRMAEGGTLVGTLDTTVGVLEDLPTVNFSIGRVHLPAKTSFGELPFTGTISELRVFVGDIGNTGLEEVTA